MYYMFCLIVDQSVEELKEKNEEDFKTRSIFELCDLTSAGIEVTFFDLDHSKKLMISDIHNIRQSKIFRSLWQEACKNADGYTVTMDVIMDSVLVPVYGDVKCMKEDFFSGKVKIKQVDKYLEMMNNNSEQLKAEFELLMTSFQETGEILNDQKPLLNHRIRQVMDYAKLFDAHKAAETMMRFKEEMKLTGDFREVEDIAQVSAFCF